MFFWQTSLQDEEPIFYINNFPVDATAALTAAHIFTMLFCVIATATGNNAWLQHIVCTPASFAQGHVWNFFTYPFYHDIAKEHIWFAIEMLMFFWFGRELERTIGRKNFCVLYLLLIFLPPLVLFFTIPLTGPFLLAGSNTLHFTIFLGYAMIFPGARFFFGFTAKWVGITFAGISTLVYLSQQNWVGFTQLWSSIAAIWGALILMGLGHAGKAFDQWKTQKIEKHEEKKRVQRAKAEENFRESVDHILEKISRDGIHSLTREEKDELARARAKLLKNDKL